MKDKNEETAKAKVSNGTARFRHREQDVGRTVIEWLSGKSIAKAFRRELHRLRAAMTHKPNGSMRTAKR